MTARDGAGSLSHRAVGTTERNTGLGSDAYDVSPASLLDIVSLRWRMFLMFPGSWLGISETPFLHLKKQLSEMSDHSPLYPKRLSFTHDLTQSPRSINQWMSSPSNQSLVCALLVSVLLFSIAFVVFHPHPDTDKLSREPRTIEIMNVDLSSNRKFRAARISYDTSQSWTIVEGQLTAILEDRPPDDDPVALEARQFQEMAIMTEA
ncbi:hypothetical protein CLOM_g5927 [Closterium sp. NIES-68]|nr:hypothetical protein CLOM_g5927 [Closterium sp. NIES-68]GJP63263.1 hypothetical protein CLOP_g20322 [Closterium sp. NIES-67]